MKKLTIEVKAVVGDRVQVLALELKAAVILAIYHTRYGTSYEVAYFHNGDRKTAYLYDHEFELAS